MRTLVLALGLGVALAAGSGCTEHVGVGPNGGDPNDPRGGSAPTSTAPLAQGVAITEVAIFQGTRVSLEKGGTKSTARALPVVAGRDALIRVYVAPLASGGGGTVTGELSLVRGGRVVASFTDKIAVSAASREDAPASTCNFDVPGAKLTSDTEFMVRLLEDGAPSVATNAENAAQYPSDGSSDSLDAVHVTDKLRVVLVPVRYTADGSGRVPDTSPAVIDALKKRMLEFYPVPDVELTVHAPVDHAKAIYPNGQGWEDVLQHVTQVRLSDNAPSDVYYYGGFAPMPTLSQFCENQCVLGLSNFGDNATDAAQHASVGALYAVNRSIDTMPHEIGHAFGRMHAPCGGASGTDPSYPYPGAQTGSWGYSVVTKALKPPTSFDQMSYCNPSWQSDYTYAGIFARLREVMGVRTDTATPGASASSGMGARSYRMLAVGADGSLAWSGESFRTNVPLHGAEQPVAFVDGSDAIVGEAVAHAYTYDHVGGGYLIVPDDLAPRAARVRIDLSRASHPMFNAARGKLGARAELAIVGNPANDTR